MKIIKKLVAAVLVLVILLGGVAVGGYFYVKNTYGIDLIKTVKQLKTLSAPVNESELCPHAFSSSDMVDVQEIVNQSVENFISYSEEHGYQVDFENLPSEMKQVIKITDKQVGALAQTVVQQETGGKLEFSGKQLGVALKQVQFSNIDANGNAKLNSVICVDITPFKAEMPEKFPFSYLKKFVPDALYISSTVFVEKGETAFSYQVSHDALTINYLNKEDTEDLFNTLDILLSVGSAQAWNEKMGGAIANALIGDEQNNGIAYSLQEIGATDYAFVQENGVDYFSVLR